MARSNINVSVRHEGVLGTTLSATRGGVDGEVVTLLGNTAPGSGAGLARWSASSEATSDGTSVWGSGAPGRWLRIETGGALSATLADAIEESEGDDNQVQVASGRVEAGDYGAEIAVRVAGVPTFIRKRGEENPARFGCARNSASDQTVKLIDMFDTCWEEGKRVIIPEGEWRVEGPVNINGRPDLSGDHRELSLFKLYGSVAKIQINSGVTGSPSHGRGLHAQGIHLRNFGVICSSGAEVGLEVGQTTVVGSTSGQSAGGVIQNLLLRGATVANLKLKAAQGITLLNNFSETLNTTGDALWIDGGDSINANTAITLLGTNKLIKSKRGIYATQCSHLYAGPGTWLEQNYEEGFLFERVNDGIAHATRSIVLRGVYHEKNNRGAGRTSGYAQMRFATADGQLINRVSIGECIFESDQASNYAISVCQGDYSIRDVALNGHTTGQYHAENNSGVTVSGRSGSTVAPASMWSAGTGANAKIVWEDGNGRKHSKIGATWYTHPVQLLGAAPPTTGTWVVSDEIINSARAPGLASGWSYVASGNWVPTGIIPVPPIGLHDFATTRYLETAGWEAGAHGGASGALFIAAVVVESQDVTSSTRIFHGKNGADTGWLLRTNATNSSMTMAAYTAANVATATPAITITSDMVGKVLVVIGIIDGPGNLLRLRIGKALESSTAFASFAPAAGVARIGTSGTGTNAASSISVLGVGAATFTSTPSEAQLDAIVDSIVESYTIPDTIDGATMTHVADVVSSPGGETGVPSLLEDRVGSDDWTITGAVAWQPFALGFVE